jgi:TPR repeat protein
MWNEFMLVRDANAGDPVAQHELGLRYLTGKGFPNDTLKAAYWIAKAAGQNLLPARYNLGILYNNGIAFAWNPFEAYKHFKYCAERGLMESEYVYGLLLTDNLTVSHDYPEAYRWMKAAADSGYEPAKEVLAEFKQRGFARLQDSLSVAAGSGKTTPSAVGGKQNSRAVRPVLLDMDADSVTYPGNKELLQEALLDAGAKLKEQLLNFSIDSLGENADTASWRGICESAEAGNPEALTLAGYHMQEGLGRPRDLLGATVYYLRAIRYESASASMLMWKLTQSAGYYAMLQKAVEANEPRAQFAWAGLALFGIDHQLTEAQAIDLLAKSARQEFPPAIVELGIRTYMGAGVKQDRGRSVQLFDHAARLGSGEASLRASMLRLNALRGAAPDSSLLHTLSRSNDDGSVLAEEMLGYLHGKGIGMMRNLSESVKYYRKAAQRGSALSYNALKGLYDDIRPADPEFQIDN